MKPKLVLANNQSKKFVSFHADLQKDNQIYDYSGYIPLLFHFSATDKTRRLLFTNVDTLKTSADYSGAYINGYMNALELASTVAIVLGFNNVPYVNRELQSAPSLSKLTAYAKLAAQGVPIPETTAGSAYALKEYIKKNPHQFPAILKRADADRGIDNYKVYSAEDVVDILNNHEEKSIWILQDFIPNNGFYLVSFYHDKPSFSIFRSLESRPDNDASKAHMFKPKGGANAELLKISDTPEIIVETSLKAIKAMNRQIASVDSLYDEAAKRVYILEVNYNPQLVTIETFKEARQQAFLEAIRDL